jgi:hypothetical protein
MSGGYAEARVILLVFFVGAAIEQFADQVPSKYETLDIIGEIS